MTRHEEGNGAVIDADLPLGWVEPHALLLKQPTDGQRLYKLVRIPYFLDMLQHSYLYFRRVDTYQDDTVDGAQLPLDSTQSQKVAFQHSPEFNLAHYYDGSRARTYACCFSLANSEYIWREYNKDGDAVCLVFEFGKLRKTLNQTIQNAIDNNLLMCGPYPCRQIFSVNYGIVEYVDRDVHHLNTERFANPVQYTFLKEKRKYAGEQELRIALSALGIGKFVLNDGSEIQFPLSLPLHFNFREAIASGTIEQIIRAPDADPAQLQYLRDEMAKLRFRPRE